MHVERLLPKTLPMIKAHHAVYPLRIWPSHKLAVLWSIKGASDIFFECVQMEPLGDRVLVKPAEASEVTF